MSLTIRFAGPHVSLQDAGRPGLGRFGVPQSGPMDRLSHAAANLAVGNASGAAAIEISLGGLVVESAVRLPFAIAGGGFIVDQQGQKSGSWRRGVLQPGDRLTIRPGPWGAWCYLALAGSIEAADWLGSQATHSPSGFGGGKVQTGGKLTLHPRITAPEGPLPCPPFARPRPVLRATLGPQDRFFTPDHIASLTDSLWHLTDAYDRMGVRLRGPRIAPETALDMPSEPVARGSVQVAGDGVATVLLADHQTTGGYPKIATALDADLDRFAQLRPRDTFRFALLSPAEAITLARTETALRARWLATLIRP